LDIFVICVVGGNNISLMMAL